MKKNIIIHILNLRINLLQFKPFKFKANGYPDFTPHLFKINGKPAQVKFGIDVDYFMKGESCKEDFLKADELLGINEKFRQDNNLT